MNAGGKEQGTKSYRESLLQNVNSRECWWEWTKNDEDEDVEGYDDDTDFAKVLNPSDDICVDFSNPLCPSFRFEEKEKERLMKPFHRTLVVKLLGQQISYGYMVKKLKKIWEWKGQIDIFDLENEFYLVNFQKMDDYMEALTGGPWVISDAYLSMAWWRPEFSPKHEKIDSIVAWVRLPDLPAPLFDKKFLLNLGNSIGKVIRLDVHTAQRTRGRFARMCVELNLNKPLVPEFCVEGQKLGVVYESLGQICNNCGRVGHMKEGCEVFHRRMNDASMVVDEAEVKENNAGVKENENGLWKTAQRTRRPRRQDLDFQNKQSGSRFSVLQEVSGEEEVAHSEAAGQGHLLRSVANENGMRKGMLQSQAKKGDSESGKGINKENEVGSSKSKGRAVVPRSKLKPIVKHGLHVTYKENLHPGDDMEVAHSIDVGDPGTTHLEREAVMFQEGVSFTSKGVTSVIRDFKFRYKLDLLVLLEPRVNGRQADRVIKNWGFRHSVRMEAEGFLGGIWILWELDDLVVNVQIMNEQFIHCKLCFGGEEMLLTTVYASPMESKRLRLWDLLYNLSREVSEPWILVGDFNEIKSPREQQGGGRVSGTRCHKFNEWIEDCNFIDIETQGPFFTWKGPKWEGLERVYKRLDHCLCSVSWHEKFEDAVVCVLPRVCSDHHPLLVKLSKENKARRPRQFKYEAMWKMHESFDSMLETSWRHNGETHDKLVILQSDLIEWNKEVFGNLEGKKRRLKTDSELWKKLVQIWPSIVANIYWDIGDGKSTKFWEDKWVEDEAEAYKEVYPIGTKPKAGFLCLALPNTCSVSSMNSASFFCFECSSVLPHWKSSLVHGYLPFRLSPTHGFGKSKVSGFPVKVLRSLCS
ncbi:hypothetical protein K1719_032192 [Acacia pycnantha]|nr:hypothetical protein K1719_032192 [Acacia pycnantha]